ncbi:MAG TPA: hypothetical protein VI233_17875 [Puia sp.]
MRKNILLAASGLVVVTSVAVLGPFSLAVSEQVLIRASLFDAAPQVTDISNWPDWNASVRQNVVVVEKGPSAIVVRQGGRLQSLEVLPGSDSRYSLVRWKSRARLAEWLSCRFRMGRALDRLKQLLEDPAGFYGFTITMHPVTDTLMLSRKVMIPSEEVDSRRIELNRSLSDYLTAHPGVGRANYFFVGVDRSLKTDSVELSVGIPVSSEGPASGGFQYLRLPAAGRLLEGSFSGAYSRMGKLRQVMEKYITGQRLMKVADPFEKWSGTDTANSVFSLEYGVY